MASIGIAGFSACIRNPEPPQAAAALDIDLVDGVSFEGDHRDLSAVAAFEAGDAFGPFKRQVQEAARKIASFAEANFLPARAREVKDAFELFQVRLFDLEACYYGTLRGVLYGPGKRSLDLFVALLERDALPLDAKKACLLELSCEITQCPPGAATHLSVAGRELQLRAGGMWEAVWARKELIAWAVVGEFIAKNHPTPNGVGDVHYRNTYFEHLNRHLGLPRQDDAAQAGYPVSQALLDEALHAIEQALAPARLAWAMAEECLACIQQGLAKDFPGGIVSAEQVEQGALDGLWQSLAPRFGRFSQARVLMETDPDGEASPLRAMTRPDLLALALLDNFRTMGLLQPSQEAVSVASWRKQLDGRSVKVDLMQWADEPLLWIKQGGMPALFEFEHLLSFGAENLPDQAQRQAAIAAAIERCPPHRLHEVPLAWVRGGDALVRLFSRFVDTTQARAFVERHRAQLLLRDTETRTQVARAGRDGCIATLVPLLKLWNLLDFQDGDRSMLRAAVERGHTTLVEALLAEGANASEPGLLHGAAGVGHAEVIRLLLEAGADPNEAEPEGRGETPLIIAAANHCEAAVRVLLDWPQTDLLAANAHGETALVACVLYGPTDLKVLKALLTRFDPDEGAGGAGTVLAAAARIGDEAYVSFLLDECEVDVDAVDANGRTALMEAARYGHAGVVKALMDHGASLLKRDHAGRTAAHHAVAEGGQTLSFFTSRLDPEHPTLPAELLMRAVQHGNLEPLDLILAWAPDLPSHDFKAAFEYSPCLIAVAAGFADCLERLLDHGFELGHHHAYPFPLALAAASGHPAVVEVLSFNDPATVNQPDQSTAGRGMTPLHKVVRTLVERDLLPDLAQAQDTGMSRASAGALPGEEGGADQPDPPVADLLAALDGALDESALDDWAELPLDVDALVQASLRESLLGERFGLVLTRLAEADARWAVADVHGHTPLGYVLAPQHAALRARLLEFLEPEKQDHLVAVAAAAFQAVTDDHPQALADLLAWDPRIAEANDQMRRSLITYAACEGRLDCLRLLLERCPGKLTTVDASGATPLIAAVQGGQPEAVRALIGCGLNVDAYGTDGRNALDWARLRNANELVPLLEPLQLRPGVKRDLPG